MMQVRVEDKKEPVEVLSPLQHRLAKIREDPRHPENHRISKMHMM